MRPYHHLALEYVHIPACLLKFPPPTPPPKPNPSNEGAEEFQSEMGMCEQKMYRKIQRDLDNIIIRKVSKASELGLNDDSVTILDEEDENGANMIVCSNGNCKFLSTDFFLERNRERCDGEPVEQQQCVLRPKEESGCKAKDIDENISGEKV